MAPLELLALLVAIGLAAFAQVALKLAAGGPPGLPWLGAAALAYLGAFGLYLHLLRSADLSWLSPLMVGGVTALTVGAGIALGEPFSPTRLLGIALILVGLAVLAQGR